MNDGPPESPEFQHASDYLRIRTYQRAVDKLEGLVVQRLFELTKANVSQTGASFFFHLLGLEEVQWCVLIGYKLRSHISKALKARSKAIQRALAIYNQAALALDPPRPKLTWSQIVEYTTIAEFELLRTGACEDICNLEWADARNRQATISHLKMARATEEIQRLNIETKRLATWIAHEALEMDEAITACVNVDPALSEAITQFTNKRKCMNAKLQVTLGHIYALPGYSGDRGFGTRQNQDEGSEMASGSSGDLTDNQNFEDVLDQVFEGVVRLTLDD